MKYTQVAADAFAKLQLNAGIILTEFDPTDPPTTDAEKEEMRANILAATGGGVQFTATPSYVDFGEDIDNVPANTKELNHLDGFDVKLSGTGKTVDKEFAAMLIAAADITGDKVVPRNVIRLTDYKTLWWVGDYSDTNTGANAGFCAIKVENALSTGGFSLQSNDNGKADFSFEFTGYYSLEDVEHVPFELYIKAGE